MTEAEARAGVDAWAAPMADRLWLRQFRLNVLYKDSHENVDMGMAGKPLGRCIVNHDYGEYDVHLFFNNIDDHEELFHTLLHEVCHAVVFEFWHAEDGVVASALERENDRLKKIVKQTFTYAHERFVQRMMNITLEAYPYPDAWETPAE